MAGGRRPVGGARLWDAASDQLGVGRFAQHDAGLGPLAPEHTRDARDGAAGPVAGDEDVEAPAGEVIDDFPGGRALVDIGIGLGLELSGEKPAVGLCQLDRLPVHADAFLGPRGQYHLGAQHAHQLAPFDREAVGHRHHQRIALLSADHGETDAGIAAGRLDHRLAGLERAGALGSLNDVEGEPILYRGCRIEEFRLGVDGPAFYSNVIDPDHRGVANGIENTVEKATTAPRRPDGCCSRHFRAPYVTGDAPGAMPDAAE